LIGQEIRAQAVPPALRRLFAATPSLREHRSGVASGPQLNQRRFLRRVLAGMGRSVNNGPRPDRTWPAPDVPTVVREPESAWWDQQEDDAGMTVAVVGETYTRWGTDTVVSRLAELAVRDELVIVYGSGPVTPSRHGDVLVGLRGSLPRHHVVALHLDRDRDEGLGRQAATLGRFLEDGSVPMLVAPAATVPDVTAEISSYLRADRVLRMSATTTGADLHQVWRRATVDLN